MDKLSKTIESYNKTADEYAEKVGKFIPEENIQLMGELLSSPAHLLDLGCGSGRDAARFEAMGISVTGIDLSDEMLQIAREKSQDATFLKMNILDLDFPENQFDAVWASASLLHVPKSDLPACFDQIKHVLKEKGYLYLSLKEGTGEGVEIDRRYQDEPKFWSYHEEADIITRLEEHGFQIVKSDITDNKNPSQSQRFISLFCRNQISHEGSF